MAIELQRIDFAGGCVITTDNRSLPIVDLFDARGRPTLGSHDAILCLAGEPGALVSFKLAEFDPVQLQ